MGKPLTQPGAYHLNRMLQSIPHDPEVAMGLLGDPEAVFERFGLTEDQRAAFRADDGDAIRALGVHPHLLMPWTMLTNEHVRAFLMVDPAHLARLPGREN